MLHCWSHFDNLSTYSRTERARARTKCSRIFNSWNKNEQGIQNNPISNVHAYTLNICCAATTQHFTYLLMRNQISVWHTINTLTHKPADECTRVLYQLTSAATERNITQRTYFCQLSPWACPRYCRDNMRLRLLSPETKTCSIDTPCYNWPLQFSAVRLLPRYYGNEMDIELSPTSSIQWK